MRIGILGAARVAQWSVLRPAKEIEGVSVRAIASRRPAEAKRLASLYGIPFVEANYESLLARNDIDLVYVPLTNNLHAKWAIKSAEAQKHVLVEKPFCVSAKEVTMLQKAAIDNGVCMLEGVMTQHHPWQSTLKGWIESERYGKLISMRTLISTTIKPREDSFRLKPGPGSGVLFDEGCYWLQMLQAVSGLQGYRIHSAAKRIGETGVDVEYTVALMLAQGATAEFRCTFEGPEQAEHTFFFAKAVVRVKNLFRCCYGSLKLVLEIQHADGNVEKFRMEPANYYVNQLLAAEQMVHHDGGDLAQAAERIQVLTEIQSA